MFGALHIRLVETACEVLSRATFFTPTRYSVTCDYMVNTMEPSPTRRVFCQCLPIVYSKFTTNRAQEVLRSY